MPLYKYLPLKYAELLVKNGTIQIGTLFGFRDEDKYGEEIGDKDEGSFTLFSLLNGELNPEDMNEIQKAAVGNINAEFIDCVAVSRQESYDFYIYSTSGLFSLSLMRKISEEYSEKYDACVKITNPVKFFELISQKLEGLAKYETTRPCFYMSKYIHYDRDKPHPALSKAKKYSYQDEYRTLWAPKNQDKITSTILTIPELTSYCELFYIDQGALREKGFPEINSKKFDNDIIKLDSNHFHNCTFNKSEIVFYAEDDISLSSCDFNHCTYVLRGSAKTTIDYLNTIYHKFSGIGPNMIENIFNQIKNKPTETPK